MKQNSILVQIRKRCFPRWRAVPIFGPLLDDFLQWMHEDQRYTLNTVSVYLNVVPKVVWWLRKRQKIHLFDELNFQHLKAAHRYFCPRHAATGSAVGVLERFLRAKRTVPEGEAITPTLTDMEINNFANYLCETRGFARKTIVGHCSQIRAFLGFLKFERYPSQLQQLQPQRIEAFLRHSSRTNCRYSLQHIVATVRTFLSWRYAQGMLSRPLHLHIDTVRTYRGDRLPKALPSEQVQVFLQSIDQTKQLGQRDFALAYLAAAYGLRSRELVNLALDDIDWQERRLRILQTKTRQTLQLPLTDEAANVLISYLRQARPKSGHRQLFLRGNAPYGPLKPTAVRQLLTRRIQHSGLNLPQCGTNILRHSFAMRLLRQGVSLKAVGDAMGHRDIESTFVYIRLDVKALREVAQPVPAAIPNNSVALVAVKNVPPIRPSFTRYNLPKSFHSFLASSMQHYVDLKRSLGRKFVQEAVVLGRWDDFVHREYPKAVRLRSEMFTRWVAELAPQRPTRSHRSQRTVMNFLLYHARNHGGTFIPDPLTFPKPAPVLLPRLISEAEMGRVLNAAKHLPPTLGNPLRAESIRLGLILFFCCGLRRGELLRVQLSDIEEENTVIRIRFTKFNKSRLVPLSPTVTDDIKQYLQQRQHHKLPMNPESFLMWSGFPGAEVYSDSALHSVWQQLCVSVQLLTPQGHPPRLHDLRHSFAVNALQRCYTHGADVQAKLPHLAMYMGHVSAVSTHYYLKFTPELREAASKRFHDRFAPLLTTGGAV